jgi:DNA-binding response OmpR family regulator
MSSGIRHLQGTCIGLNESIGGRTPPAREHRMSKIMVIEEDSAMRMLLCEWLTAEGHRVDSAARHDAARETLQDPVALVVLDLPRPRTHAAATASLVRSVRNAFQHAPVLGISTQLARSLGSGSEVGRALGVEGLLAKPCTRQELLGAVAAVL